MYAWVYVSMVLWMDLCVYASVACVCMHACVHVCVHARMYACMTVWTRVECFVRNECLVCMLCVVRVCCMCCMRCVLYAM